MIRAEYLITTPLFMGGAVHDKCADPELRVPSIKGLVRFWFRAVAWPSMRSVEEIWEKEKELFGSADGQGKFLFSSQSSDLKIGVPDSQKPIGLSYLGYGTYGSRKFFQPGDRFTLELKFREHRKKKVTDEDIDYLKKSLTALGLFGGAGSRSRRGFGSLTLTNLEIDGKRVWSKPNSFEELEERIRSFISELSIRDLSEEDDFPPYTSFSSQTRVSVVDGSSSENALRLLNKIGIEFINYRREVGRKEGDGALVLDFLRGAEINEHPSRAVFGLPHNYYFRNIGKSASVEPSGSVNKRRASPLFIHIHALNKGRFAAVLTLLPAVFLPKDKMITIKEKVNKKKRKVENEEKKAEVVPNVNIELIENFLNKFRVVWP
ncbi:MAG: type III-B CRISPR module RAMP protein Cmr1 [Clostridia bacterium]|nr:type III-B CRISPR module RAMP protein Cmr1 [Clostridia bacterium]